jgi:hypothetical protein
MRVSVTVESVPEASSPGRAWVLLVRRSALPAYVETFSSYSRAVEAVERQAFGLDPVAVDPYGAGEYWDHEVDEDVYIDLYPSGWSGP